MTTPGNIVSLARKRDAEERPLNIMVVSHDEALGGDIKSFLAAKGHAAYAYKERQENKDSGRLFADLREQVFLYKGNKPLDLIIMVDPSPDALFSHPDEPFKPVERILSRNDVQNTPTLVITNGEKYPQIEQLLKHGINTPDAPVFILERAPFMQEGNPAAFATLERGMREILAAAARAKAESGPGR